MLALPGKTVHGRASADRLPASRRDKTASLAAPGGAGQGGLIAARGAVQSRLWAMAVVAGVVYLGSRG
jgi:hypothetical protein